MKLEPLIDDTEKKNDYNRRLEKLIGWTCSLDEGVREKNAYVTTLLRALRKLFHRRSEEKTT